MTEHPIQPSPEQFGEWLAEACRQWPGGRPGDIADVVARLAYAAGADAELEACVEWLEQNQGRWEIPASLRAARRPKPPSLKEQALDALDRLSRWNGDHEAEAFIRRALEAFPDES